MPVADSDRKPSVREDHAQTAPSFLNEEIALRVEGITKTFARTENKERRATRGLKRMMFRRASDPETREKRVVDNITLYARKGEALGILGPNGCGKSTLVRMISTLLIPDAGKIEIFGLDVVSDARAVKRIINRVSVDAAFFKRLSSLENLLYAARLYDISPDVAMERARKILGMLGFDAEHLENSMEQLSRGQQQKVAIARAFLTTPRLVLLDEPTTGLDPKSKKDVAAFINRLRSEQDVTLLLTTHDMVEAEALCDRIAILNKGRLIALGTAQELKEQARTSVGADMPTLEQVFLALVGEKIEDADEKEDEAPASPLLNAANTTEASHSE